MKRDVITLNQIKKALKSKGFGVVMLLFALPIAIPLPYPPGFTTILGMPLLLFALQFFIQAESPWLPSFIGKKSFERSKIANVLEITAPYMRKLERLTRPRLWFFEKGSLAVRISALFMILNSICVILPIFFGNAIPAFGTVLISLGLIRKDGLAIILGMFFSVVGWLVAALVVTFGVEVIQKIFT